MTGPRLRVRMGLHFGEVVGRGGDYFGPVVNLTARLKAAGHGGRVLATDQRLTGREGPAWSNHDPLWMSHYSGVYRSYDIHVRGWQTGSHYELDGYWELGWGGDC